MIKVSRYKLLLILGLHFNTYSQEVTELTAEKFNQQLAPYLAVFNNQETQFGFTKETYEDKNSKVLIETQRGRVFHGKGGTYKLELPGLIVIQNEQLCLMVDSTLGMMQLSDVNIQMKSMMGFSGYSNETLKMYKLAQISYPTYEVLKCTPIDETLEELSFYLDRKSKRLFKIEIVLPKSNYFAQSQDDNTLEEPKIVLLYDPIKPLEKDSNIFSTDSYIIVENTGKYVPTNRWGTYKIHDSRTNTLK